MQKKAILIGATGLTGSFVLKQLLEDTDYSEVIVLTRAPLNQTHPKLKEIIVNFDELKNYATSIKGDTVFCCLGTTIKKAGSQEAFKKVDFEYPLEVAKIAKENGASAYLLITAIGSAKDSMIFYSRTKGEVEAAIEALQFDTLHILRPALILGDRKETRIGESIARATAPILDALMIGPLAKYKSISAEKIAKAMIYYSKLNSKGVFVHENNELRKV
jgi:uncharacterized protein YbjT (DUF2867 family)